MNARSEVECAQHASTKVKDAKTKDMFPFFPSEAIKTCTMVQKNR